MVDMPRPYSAGRRTRLLRSDRAGERCGSPHRGTPHPIAPEAKPVGVREGDRAPGSVGDRREVTDELLDGRFQSVIAMLRSCLGVVGDWGSVWRVVRGVVMGGG